MTVSGVYILPRMTVSGVCVYITEHDRIWCVYIAARMTVSGVYILPCMTVSGVCIYYRA